MKASPSPALGAQTPISILQYGRALVVLILIRLGLSLFGFKRLERFMPHVGRKAGSLNPWQISWSIKRTARYVPWASCLTQGIALQYLLSRHGESTVMCVGVKPDNQGKFTAHAWLLLDNQIIIGGDKNLKEFQEIARLEARSR